MSSRSTYQVSIWALRHLKGRRRPHGVRWRTADKEHSEWYATKALADSFRTDLVQAQRRGEEFDVQTGLPRSIRTTRNAKTLLELAIAFVDWQWTKAPPNTRRATVVNLAAILPLFTQRVDNPPMPARLQHLLSTRVLPPPQRALGLDTADSAALSWLRRASRPVADLFDDLTARELLQAIGTTVTGRVVTSSTWDKRRAVLNRTLQFAVEAGLLDRNPVSGRSLPTGRVVEAVDPWAVVNPQQAQQLLAAVTYVGGRRRCDRDRGRRLYAFFCCLYYGGLRPGEALALRRTDCKLPDTGWGELLLPRSLPGVSGRYYLDSPSGLQVRPLKRRRVEDVRPVPIPPTLVHILQEHISEFGTARDGRLFPAQQTGQGVPAAVYTRIWTQARAIGLDPTQQASPLAKRPYDLRHAALSTWLNAGVPPAEVAERAGHSIKVLLTVYAKCLHGQRDTFNAHIERALGVNVALT